MPTRRASAISTRFGDIVCATVEITSPATQGAFVEVPTPLPDLPFDNVSWESWLEVSPGKKIGPGHTASAGFEYDLSFTLFNVRCHLHPTNSANILSKPVRIFFWRIVR